MNNGFPKNITDDLLILGNDYFPVYLIQGRDKCALMETGISATADRVLKQLSLLKLRPDYLIVSHPHSDHITGLDYLREHFPEAVIVAGKGTQGFITHPKAEKSILHEDSYMSQSLLSLGVCRKQALIASVPSTDGWKIVEGDEELDLGNTMIRILQAQGHSPGQLIVEIPHVNTLFVSDALGNYYPGKGFFPTFFTGFEGYMATISRIEKKNPSIIGLGHNGYFAEHAEIRGILQAARRAAVDVKNYVAADQRSDEVIALDLFGFYYADELKIYSPQNILNCCRLLVRRIRECYP